MRTRGGRGSKIPKILCTYFMDAPYNINIKFCLSQFNREDAVSQKKQSPSALLKPLPPTPTKKLPAVIRRSLHARPHAHFLPFFHIHTCVIMELTLLTRYASCSVSPLLVISMSKKMGLGWRVQRSRRDWSLCTFLALFFLRWPCWGWCTHDVCRGYQLSLS